MLKYLAFLLAFLPLQAWAACTSIQTGSFTSYQCDDGRTGSSITTGSFTSYQGPLFEQPSRIDRRRQERTQQRRQPRQPAKQQPYSWQRYSK